MFSSLSCSKEYLIILEVVTVISTQITLQCWQYLHLGFDPIADEVIQVTKAGIGPCNEVKELHMKPRGNILTRI